MLLYHSFTKNASLGQCVILSSLSRKNNSLDKLQNKLFWRNNGFMTKWHFLAKCRFAKWRPFRIFYTLDVKTVERWILALFTCISTSDIPSSEITRTKRIRTAVIRGRVTVTSTLSSEPQKDAIMIVWSVIWEKLSFARRDKFFLTKYPSFEIALFPGTKPDLILTFYVDRSTTVRIVIFTISSIFLVYVFSVNISPVCVTFVEMIEDFHINRLEFRVFDRPTKFSIKESILRILFNKIFSMKKSS